MTTNERAYLLEEFGLPPTATDGEIKKKYHQLSKRYHPDSRHRSAEPNEELFKYYKELYERIGTAESRPIAETTEIEGFVMTDFARVYTGQVITIRWQFTGADEITLLNTHEKVPPGGTKRIQIPYQHRGPLTVQLVAVNSTSGRVAQAEIILDVISIWHHLIVQIKPFGLLLLRLVIGYVTGYTLFKLFML